MRTAMICMMALMFLSGCRSDPSYEKVFQHPMGEWESRASRLSNADLIAAYIYGIEHRRPPTVLSEPIARRSGGVFFEIINRAILSKDDYLLSSLIMIAEEKEKNYPGSVCKIRKYNKYLILSFNLISDDRIKSTAKKNLAILCHGVVGN